LAKRSETTHEKGDGHGPGCNVRAINQQLESGSVGAQNDMLAPTDVDQDVLQARQGSDTDGRIFNRRGPHGLGDSRQHRRSGLRQPDVTRFKSGEGRVGESTRAPTPQQEARVPASA
jgi:hypothetical protein